MGIIKKCIFILLRILVKINWYFKYNAENLEKYLLKRHLFVGWYYQFYIECKFIEFCVKINYFLSNIFEKIFIFCTIKLNKFV